MKAVGIIPARLGSSRFPGKPLAPLLGRPMIEHVFKRAALSDALDAVYVATCDEEIASVVRAFGGQAIMTSPAHERGTDRIAEAASTLGLAEEDVVVNIQGDEPLLVPEMIGLSVAPLRTDASLECVNLCAPISVADFEDRNEIKIVADQRGFALYMSREPIPTRIRQGSAIPRYKQVCVIAFRWPTLRAYTTLSETPLEQAESIDMLRLLEHGRAVKLVESPYATFAVDTPEGLAAVEQRMKNDPVLARYT
jgi:3-deoxy-manno-octulosonate cytidylyltransferase (CMP-KDO synthetase)